MIRGRISPALRQYLDAARVPRSLPALIERATAPETDQTPDVDPILVVTTANALRELQRIVAEQGREIERWKRRVTDLEARESL